MFLAIQNLSLGLAALCAVDPLRARVGALELLPLAVCHRAESRSIGVRAGGQLCARRRLVADGGLLGPIGGPISAKDGTAAHGAPSP